MRVQGVGEDSKVKLQRWCKKDLGGHNIVRRVDRNAEALAWCRKSSCYARQKTGTKSDEPMQTRKDGHERVWKDLRTNPHPRRSEGSWQKRERERVENWRGKKSHKERVQEAERGIWRWKFHGTKRFVEDRQILEDWGAWLEEDVDLIREYKAMPTRTFSALGWGRMWKVELKRWRVSREAQGEEDKSGKREVEGERERVEAHSKRVCLDHFP